MSAIHRWWSIVHIILFSWCSCSTQMMISCSYHSVQLVFMLNTDDDQLFISFCSAGVHAQHKWWLVVHIILFSWCSCSTQRMISCPYSVQLVFMLYTEDDQLFISFCSVGVHALHRWWSDVHIIFSWCCSCSKQIMIRCSYYPVQLVLFMLYTDDDQLFISSCSAGIVHVHGSGS